MMKSAWEGSLRKLVIAGFLFTTLLASLTAQSHNAVPVTEVALYDFLELAQIRGLLRVLPSAKPYPRSLVVRSLYEVDTHRSRLSPHEQAVLDDLIERYAEDVDKPFLQDWDVRIEDDVFPTKIGAYLTGIVSTDLGNFTDSLGGMGILGFYIQGDMGRHVSWGIDFSGGLFLADDYDTAYNYGPAGWEPYTFTKTWDGGLHPISSLSSFTQMPTSLSGGYTFEPEIAASFWDNRLDLRFGRLRHDWGIGEGSLFLDAGARPFFGIETTMSPFKWINLSAMTGVLEYGENFRNHASYSIWKTAQEQQNMFSVLQIDVNPVDWLHISIFDAAIYLKRPELGYVFPFMSRFISQNNTGDFDNLMLGGTLGLSWPGVFRTYFSFYLDEARFDEPNFFHDPANMYSFQAGIKVPIPGLPWSNLTVQYTKIEPFTYTHYYYKDSPWYTPVDSDNDGHPDYAMDTGYMNGGESLGYGLEPNSDEIMLQLNSHFRRGITWMGRYRMIRHGFPGSVNGSTFDAWGFDPGDDTITSGTDLNGAYHPGATKDFLKDGIYEWFHIFSLGGTLDMRIWNEPVQFGLNYSFVYLYYTDYSTNGHFKPLDNAAFPNTIRNIITISVSVSPY